MMNLACTWWRAEDSEREGSAGTHEADATRYMVRNVTQTRVVAHVLEALGGVSRCMTELLW